MTDEPLKKCPQVRQEEAAPPLRHRAAIIFKGSGFYETDYRSESYKAAAKAEEESKPADRRKDAQRHNRYAPATGKLGRRSGQAGGEKTAKSEDLSFR